MFAANNLSLESQVHDIRADQPSDRNSESDLTIPIVVEERVEFASSVDCGEYIWRVSTEDR